MSKSPEDNAPKSGIAAIEELAKILSHSYQTTDGAHFSGAGGAMPTFMAIIKPCSVPSEICDENTGKPVMLVPTVVLEVMNMDAPGDGNSIRFLLQPSSAAGFFLMLQHYFSMIGYDPETEELNEAMDKAEQYVEDREEPPEDDYE